MRMGKMASTVSFHRCLETIKTVECQSGGGGSSVWFILTCIHSVTDWRLVGKYWCWKWQKIQPKLAIERNVIYCLSNWKASVKLDSET